MLTTTTPDVPGKKISEVLGIVRGNTVRTRWFGRDIAAAFKNIVGGEIKSYTQMVSSSRDEAYNRMIDEAEKLGADAVVNIKFTMGEVMQGAVEMLAYGTAVKLK